MIKSLPRIFQKIQIFKVGKSVKLSENKIKNPSFQGGNIRGLVLKIIIFYKNFISPYLGNHCRFYPTCSEYFYQAIKEKGIIFGCWKGVKRILRCNPWGRGGVDFP